MSDHSLHDIYSRIQAGYKHVFVVPLIRYDFPKSDYLYLLYSSFIEDKPEVSIHSTSAMGHLKFLLYQVLGKRPILHYHWLEFQDMKSLFGMIYKVKIIWFYRFLGGKIIWTIHNLKPHDGLWLGFHKKLHRWMAKKSDVILVHSTSQIDEVCNRYSIEHSKIEVIPHPVFPAEITDKSSAIDVLNSRFSLNLKPSMNIVGAFGAISKYKNFEKTIEALDESNFSGKFLIFGYVKKGQQSVHNFLDHASKKYSWLIYKPGFVQEKDIPAIMSSMDFCLFNFTDIHNSGGIEMARSYKRKIIAPRIGILKDLESHEDSYLFSNQDQLKTLLKSLLV